MTEEPEGRQFLALVAEIPGAGLRFTYHDGPFAESGILFRTDCGVRAWRNLCRHLAVPLDRTDPGCLTTPDGRHLVCGEHGALYRPDDGLCVAGPCLGARLRALPVVVCGGKAYLDTAALPDSLAGWGQP